MTEPTDTDIRAFDAPPGGIMTDDAGAITGAVEAWIDGDHVRIRYEGALDTYTVNGTVDGRTDDEVFDALATDRGVDEYDNPITVDLT